MPMAAGARIPKIPSDRKFAHRNDLAKALIVRRDPLLAVRAVADNVIVSEYDMTSKYTYLELIKKCDKYVDVNQLPQAAGISSDDRNHLLTRSTRFLGFLIELTILPGTTTGSHPSIGSKSLGMTQT